MKPNTELLIRAARATDLPALGRLGAALALAHHRWDPQRFFVTPKMHEGYAWWLGRELKNKNAIILVGEHRGRVVGYAYGTVEPRDWNALRDTCGIGVDLIVDPKARGLGLGAALAKELIAAFTEKGVPRVILLAAAKNTYAQRFFRSLGCRTTVLEMALELPRKKRPARKGRARTGAAS